MPRNRRRIPVAREGLPFIAGFTAAGVLLLFIPILLIQVFGAACLVLGVFCLFFFRDPERNPEDDPRFILAPGHGRILEITEESNPIVGSRARVVRIFLSVFDIHVQHSPISGIISAIEYRSGRFYDARDPRACFENEQNVIVIENERRKIVVKQIAGLIARRIVCWVEKGQAVRTGQRLGLIRFGSQVDVVIPQDAEVCVSVGDMVTSGVSVIALLKDEMTQDRSTKEVSAGVSGF